MKIEFIIPTYNSPNQLKTIVGSLLSQTSPNWTCQIISDGCDEDINHENIRFISQLKDDRINYTRIEGPNKDWGHTARNYGLKRAKEEWVVMTGCDNYYMPVFVQDFLNIAKYHTSSLFVFCDMVHNLAFGGYKIITSELKLGMIDIGNFMAKTKFAQQIELNMHSYQADWFFIEEYLKKFVKHQNMIKKINKILYVHN